MRLRSKRLIAIAFVLGALPLSAATATAATPISASQVATGRTHSCAILTTGQVVCWGGNFYGELGNGTNTPSTTPVPVTGLGDAVAISANGEFTTCAIRAGGQAVCWGKNISGQIGDGTKLDRNVPTAVTGLNDAVSISSGPYHTCAIRVSEQAVCWGDNEHGELGDNSTAEHLTPVDVTGLSDARNIAAGENHTCAARDGGQALCWGYPVNGVLGLGSGVVDVKVPTPVKGPGGTGNLEEVVELVGGSTHSCARQESGQMYCWGDNYFGRLGNDSTENTNVPVAVDGMSDAKFISAGYASSCAIRESGQALCWGSNANSRLGDGTSTERHVPTPVSGLTDAVQISGKLGHMCAVRVSGQVVCWGGNTAGELGDGSTSPSATPVVVVAGEGGSGNSGNGEPGGGAPAGGAPAGGSPGGGGSAGGKAAGRKPSFAAPRVKLEAKKVAPGSKTKVVLTVKNAGPSAVKGVKVCVKAPKKLVATKACRSIGKLAPGKAKKAGFTVRIKRSAKSGAKAKLTFTVRGSKGVKKRRVVTTITVR